MAVEGSGLSENVFIQSPRVRFGEPPGPSAQSSLLTFADMVLSFDRKTALQNTKLTSESNLIESDHLNQDENRRSFDHTYASCRSARATRSQTAKIAHQSGLFSDRPEVKVDQDLDLEDCNTNSDTDSDFEMELDLDLNSHIDEKSRMAPNQEEKANARLPQFHGLSQTPPSATPEPFSPHNYCVRSKRCSSEENISVETLQSNRSNAHQSWLQSQTKLDKHSRKSCSSENVDKKTRIKSCKSSESVQKECVSQTLHRFVNNTLEFPCWPRKADHTYATATWDGTAASHSLFEEDKCSHSKRNIPKTEDCPMEELDRCISSPVQTGYVASTQPLSQCSNFSNIQQKEDHTYVKHVNNTDKEGAVIGAPLARSSVQEKPMTSNGTSHPKSSPGAVDSYANWPHRFSSATFPRLKSRDDHTYFHSGLAGNNGSARGGREWLSAQSVASSELSQDMQIEETYRSLHSFSQSASAKKDHNYSTSA